MKVVGPQDVDKSEKTIEAKFIQSMQSKKNVNLFNELLEIARRVGPNAKIVEDIRAAISYKKLILSIYVLSLKLKAHLAKEERIGVLLPNAIGNIVTIFSLFRMGKTPAMLNFSMGAESLKDCCETASVRTILTSRVFIEKGNLQAIVDFLAQGCRILYLEDLQKTITLGDKIKGLLLYLAGKRSSAEVNEMIQFTSGTESKPKGVVLSHDNLFANAKQALAVLDIDNEDKVFNSLPMFHCFGLMLVILPILNGIPLYLYPSPLHYKEIPQLVRKTKSTIMCGTSTFLEGYAAYADDQDFASMRYVIAGGEKLKAEVAQLWHQRFAITILEGYGVTETAPILSLNTPAALRKGTVGRFVPGVEYKIVPVEGIAKGGNLHVKGPNVMKGYLIHGKGYVPLQGWHDCGDIATVDEDGFISIHSRLKRFAKIGGEMVSLNLVEKLAMECFGHTGFYAVSVPAEKKGEQVVLYTTKEDADEKVLRRYIMQQKLSALLIPSKMTYTNVVPLLGSGKTDYVTFTEKAKQLTM
ncbi:AMP-binding protein [Paenibacillus aestuarii]|uniref:AMP-binding protein n=1 Tax=Paenibacillus aestuarii TaxID=516965 RepID=A0ABW0K0B0_9BACL|nr:AMP-binding protein [Paenibacillus aestuarii]